MELMGLPNTQTETSLAFINTSFQIHTQLRIFDYLNHVDHDPAFNPIPTFGSNRMTGEG